MTESQALGTYQMGGNTMESVLAEDAEASLANGTERDYIVLSRTAGPINTLLKERDLMGEHGRRGTDDILETYVPVDYYIVVGFHQKNDSISETVIRVVDINTKEVEIFVLEHLIDSHSTDGDYTQISPTVEQKIQEIVAEKKDKEAN